MSSTGNWVSFDNLKLVYNGISVDSLHLELQKNIDNAQLILNGGVGVENLQAAIDNAKLYLTSESSKDISNVARILDNAIIAYRISNATGTIPELFTNEYVATGAAIALGRFTFRSNGASIYEKGFCWSTTDEPTIADKKSTEKFSNRGDIYRMDKLNPSTIYYVRPYIITRGYQVAYGKTVKIATLPMGNMTYIYDNGGGLEENNRIKSALEETIWLYNNLSYVRGVNLDVHYGASTPTADCSYGGWMRVGPNSSYQQTGTILHEASHGVGVGTSNEWRSNIFREEGDRGR